MSERTAFSLPEITEIERAWLVAFSPEQDLPEGLHSIYFEALEDVCSIARHRELKWFDLVDEVQCHHHTGNERHLIPLAWRARGLLSIDAEGRVTLDPAAAERETSAAVRYPREILRVSQELRAYYAHTDGGCGNETAKALGAILEQHSRHQREPGTPRISGYLFEELLYAGALDEVLVCGETDTFQGEPVYRLVESSQ